MARLIKAGETTAARKRLFFHLVGTDGITAATGEAGGQPQISSDGAAFTSTGIGVLVSLGNGRYYAELTDATVATAGVEIESRYKSSNTAECPGDSALVVSYDPYAVPAAVWDYSPRTLTSTDDDSGSGSASGSSQSSVSGDDAQPSVGLFTSLQELKGFLQIDPLDRREDKLLTFYSQAAAAWIEKYLNRRGYLKRERTEFYDGSGTQVLQLLSLPVWASPTPRAWIDDEGTYGLADSAFSDDEMEYGVDFALQRRDTTLGYSETGLLIRLRHVWTRPGVRQRGYLSPFIDRANGNIKVTYTGGHTSDTLPYDIVLAAVQVIARMRMMFPLGVPLASESYEDRSISQWNSANDRHWMTAQVKHLLFSHRRWKF